MRTPADNLFFFGGAIFSVAVHVGVAAFFFMGGENEDVEAAVAPELMVFEEVELLKWGEVMPDPNELPTISNPEQETREQDVVTLDQEPDIQQPPDDENEDATPEEETPDPEQRQDDSRHNPDRPTNNEPIQGSSEGYRHGTSLSATAMANLFGPVQEQIQRAVRPPSTLSQAQLEELEGVISIYVNEDGRVRRFTWRSRTGNAGYDGAIERAINLFRLGSRRLRLPTHNPAAMQQAVDGGFRITIRGHR